jgi:hypothetical protein
MLSFSVGEQWSNREARWRELQGIRQSVPTAIPSPTNSSEAAWHRIFDDERTGAKPPLLSPVNSAIGAASAWFGLSRPPEKEESRRGVRMVRRQRSAVNEGMIACQCMSMSSLRDRI